MSERRSLLRRLRPVEANSRPIVIAVAALGLIVVWLILDRALPRGLPLGIVVLGTVFGSLNALLAIGIVLVYRANRVVNFAQAELGAVAAVLAIEFKLQWRWNFFLAIAAGLIMAAAVGAIVDLAIIRRFKDAPRLLVAVATIGVAQILNGLSILIPIWWTGFTRTGENFTTPFTARFSIDPVVFRGDHALALILVPFVIVGLTIFLKYTDYGVAIRAAPENRDRANLLGIPVQRLSAIVWGVGGLLSGLAILLRVPILGFTSFTGVSGSGSSLILRTLAAAVIARMESLPVAAAAAIGLGIFQETVFWTFSGGTYVDALLVAVILIALFLQRGRFSRAAETGIAGWKALREVRPVPHELRKLPEVRFGLAALKALIVIFLVAFPAFARPSHEQLAALIFIYAIVALSLVVLTGWAGQISLGQWALAGFGGATTGILLERHGWDVFLALAAGIIVAAGAALLIGLPALRITGPFLAVTTLAFAVTSLTFFLEDRYFPWFIADRISRPILWQRLRIDQDWQIYYLCLVALGAVILVVRNLRKTRIGRTLIATRDNEPAAQSAGINTTRAKLTAFLISGGIAGLAGGLYVLHQNGLHTDSFGPEVSLRLFSMVVIGGLGSIPGAILGAVYVRGAEYLLPGGWSLIASGGGILLLLMVVPGGLGEILYRTRDRLLRRVAANRGLVVPSLAADVRVEEVPAARLEAAFARLGLGAGGDGSREAGSAEKDPAGSLTDGSRRS